MELPKPFHASCSAALSARAASRIVSTASLVVEVEAYQTLMHYEPIALWMRREGYRPEAGDFIVVPDSYREFLGPVPNYVRFSLFARAATLSRGAQLPPNGFEKSAREFRVTSGFGDLDNPPTLPVPLELDVLLDS
jgi:phenylalanine-4-hydroxylase